MGVAMYLQQRAKMETTLTLMQLPPLLPTVVMMGVAMHLQQMAKMETTLTVMQLPLLMRMVTVVMHLQPLQPDQLTHALAAIDHPPTIDHPPALAAIDHPA